MDKQNRSATDEQDEPSMDEQHRSPGANQIPPRATILVLRDFALGLLVFALTVGAFNLSGSAAFPVPPPPDLLSLSTLVRPEAMVVPTLKEVAPVPLLSPGPPGYVLTLLALVFALLTAFNLAVLRHLRGAYAAPQPAH